jgi:hypothetical protein
LHAGKQIGSAEPNHATLTASQLADCAEATQPAGGTHPYQAFSQSACAVAEVAPASEALHSTNLAHHVETSSAELRPPLPLVQPPTTKPTKRSGAQRRIAK